MTYKQLLKHLQSLSKEQLEQTVTIYHRPLDEYLGAHTTGITGEECDVLDPEHFYIEVSPYDIKGWTS